MRLQRSALITALAIPLILLLALPGAATQPAEEEAGNPLFLTGPNEGDPDDIAITYIRENASDFGVTAADVAELEVTSSYTSKHNGVTHVNIGQLRDDLEVFVGRATVNIAEDGSVIYVGASLVRLSPPESATADTTATEAVEAAADGLDLDDPRGLRVLRRSRAASQETVVSGGGISDEPIPARLGWQPTSKGLRLAWQLVIDDSTDESVWNATVDADTGALLDVDDWTDEHSAEDLAHLARTGSGPSTTTHVSPDPVDDGSSYLVYDIPKESPNDAERAVVTNGADGLASPFGWHDSDGVAGAEETITRGNNVHAYTDQDANGDPDPDGQPDGGAGLDFQFAADLTEHAQTYRDAAVTNLFYFNNIIHDVLYRYGFDDEAGNFQASNYGRGGEGGDDVRAEAADGNGTNNANFFTPARDGERPRMQMYLWPGTQFGLPNALTVGSGDDAVTLPAHYARFTPAPTNAGTAGQLVLVDDGVVGANPRGGDRPPVGTVNDGCEPYPALPAGSIALVDRANDVPDEEGEPRLGQLCNYYTQVVNAQNAGAVAVVVAHNSDGNAPILSGSMDPPVAIPAISVTQANGDAIKAELPAAGRVHKSATHPGIRDGDFENGIIIHEYGHGVSNRLTGGPTVNCLSGDERMGEGWSDYLAIAMLLDPELDDPEGPRGMGPYALFQDSRQGNGIRPRPYSRDMNIQPFTYDRIKTDAWITGRSLATPHGVGHTWAATLWDMTWDLIDRHGFNDNLYDSWDAGGNNLAYQLVIDGLKFQGCGPGFVRGRDAILAADAALTGGENQCLLWTSFARRGLGYSAVQGTTDRNDNTEAFDVPPSCGGPGAGFVRHVGNAPAVNVRDAGAAVPIDFNLGGNLGLDLLKARHSPSSQEIDCTTLEPLQFAITTPTQTPGSSRLTYNASQGYYTYRWLTDEGWEGTCRQFILTLEDGRQHRANFRFGAPA